MRANEIGELAVSRIMAGSTVDSQGIFFCFNFLCRTISVPGL